MPFSFFAKTAHFLPYSKYRINLSRQRRKIRVLYRDVMSLRKPKQRKLLLKMQNSANLITRSSTDVHAMRSLNKTSHLIIICDLNKIIFWQKFFRYGKFVAQHTFNHLKPSGFFTYHQVKHSKILHGASFMLSVLYGSQNKQGLLLHT